MAQAVRSQADTNQQTGKGTRIHPVVVTCTEPNLQPPATSHIRTTSNTGQCGNAGAAYMYTVCCCTGVWGCASKDTEAQLKTLHKSKTSNPSPPSQRHGFCHPAGMLYSSNAPEPVLGSDDRSLQACPCVRNARGSHASNSCIVTALLLHTFEHCHVQTKPLCRLQHDCCVPRIHRLARE